MRRLWHTKLALLLTASAALAVFTAPFAGDALAQAKSEKKVKLSISAQVHRALMIADDGDQSDLFHVDNDTSPTAFNLTGKVQATDDLTIGSQIEAQIESNSSADVSQSTENSSTGSTSFSERKLEVFFHSKRFGKLWLGQGAAASEGISEIDLSGTNVVLRSNFGTFGKSLLFRNSTTNTLSAVTIGTVLDNFDGLGRVDRLRYDTPRFFGFMASAGAVQGGATDFALRYSAQYGDTKVAAGFSIVNRAANSSTIDTQWSGSGSVVLDNGLNLTVAGGARDLKAAGRTNPDFLYIKAGYRARWFDVGKTSFTIEWGGEDDLAANGDEATIYGIAIAQKVGEWGTDFYAGYRIYELDRTGTSFDDISVGMAGVRMKF